MTFRGWTWQLWREDGSFVSVYSGMAHAKRDIMPDSFHVIQATGHGLCYRMIVYDGDKTGAVYFLRRLLPKQIPTPTPEWIVDVHRKRPHQRKKKR